MSESKSAFRAAKAERSTLRWLFGWHPVVGWAMVVFLLGGVGYYLRASYQFALVGLVLGGPIWYQGMRYINRHWESIRDGYLTDVEKYGPTVLEAAGMDEGADVFTLTKTPEDTQPFVEAPEQVDATLVGVDGTGVYIYETTLDLMFLKAGIGTDPEQVIHFPSSNLERAEYEDGTLVISPVRETEDLVTYRTPVDAEPVELLARIREQAQ
ncbi:MAG: hypothetical protein ABEJ84_07735 [Halodesulfurarchaeum sp.]